MPCWNEHGPTAFFWAGIIIDVQSSWLSLHRHAHSCMLRPYRVYACAVGVK